MKPEKQLYQWDVNQYLTGINPAAQYVDYTIGNEVIRLETDGTRCRIPDEVLQTYGGKTCYERYPDGTFRAYSFSVLYAPKPPDYVYTPEERTTFEALTARVDAAIDEIKRRADSGEFTPVKGVDYFTESEKNELMESVSTGAIGEFRKVVDTATTDYNDNHNLKLDKYNANAAEKLESYNSNHTAKVAEYDANAENKTAEFDANAAALQTEVDRLRGECDKLAAENRKQENRISALMKLNKGQTYDILPEEGETASRTAPSGAKYVSVDKVGGHSEVVDGEIISSQTDRVDVARADGTTSQQITTGFPELKSAGTAHDEIDMDSGQVIRNVYTVELDTLQWNKDEANRFVANLPAQAKAAGTYNDTNNELCNTYESKTLNEIFAGNVGIATHPINGKKVWIYDNNYDTPEQLVASLAGAVLHYELATPTTEPVTIPEALQEWLPVEPGGTVTFRNADESKQLPVPNAVSWVRKLDEVN